MLETILSPARNRPGAVRALALAASVCTTLLIPACERADLRPAPVATVEVSAPSSVLQLGDKARLTVRLKDAQGRTLSDRPVHWSSEDTTLVVVDPEGVARVVADPPEPRAVEVRATSEGVVGSASLNIGSIPAARVEIVPGSDSLYVGESTTLRALVYSADGSVLNRRVQWSSGNPAKLTVDSMGTATAVGKLPIHDRPTPVIVEARVGNLADSVEIYPIPPVQRVYAWASERVVLGRDVRLWALAAIYYELAGGSPGPVPIRWRSSDSSVVAVDSGGSAVAKGVGTAVLIAEANGKADTVSIRVGTAGYRVTYLGTLGGSYSSALDLNDKAQVVGNASTAAGDTVAFFWENGGMRALGADRFRSYWRGFYGSALINSLGQVAGFSTFDTPEGGSVRAVNEAGDYVVASGGDLFLSRNGELTELPREYPATVLAMNSRADVGGNDGYASVIWWAEHPLRAERVSSSAWAGSVSITAINDAGVWVESGGYKISGASVGLSGGEVRITPNCSLRCSTAGSDINEKNEVVGGLTMDRWFPDGTYREVGTGFLWQNGALSDLTDLLVDPDWVITEARAINERGEIAGSGRNLRTGQSGGVLLTPTVPQP